MPPCILGPGGQPIESKVLAEEIATPSVTGIRHVFDEAVSPSLNPARMARILRDAAESDMHDFLTMAAEMEEREMQYRTA